MTCPKHPIFQVVPRNLVGSARSDADLHCHSSSDANLARGAVWECCPSVQGSRKIVVCFQPSQPHCWDHSGNGPQLPLTLLQPQEDGEDGSTSAEKPSKSHTLSV